MDVVLVSTPENIFYLSGLSDWGFFAPVMMVVPLDGDLVISTRENKAPTVERQVAVAGFEGHSDSETVAGAIARVLVARDRARDCIGLEMWSSGPSHGLAVELRRLLPEAVWKDASGMVDELRATLSPAEQDYVRRSARVTNQHCPAHRRRSRTTDPFANGRDHPMMIDVASGRDWGRVATTGGTLRSSAVVALIAEWLAGGSRGSAGTEPLPVRLFGGSEGAQPPL